MSDYVRVYHPTSNAWQDIPKSDVDGWKESGWLRTKPAHVDDSNALPPGPQFVANVPVRPVPEPAPAKAVKAEEK